MAELECKLADTESALAREGDLRVGIETQLAQERARSKELGLIEDRPDMCISEITTARRLLALKNQSPREWETIDGLIAEVGDLVFWLSIRRSLAQSATFGEVEPATSAIYESGYRKACMDVVRNFKLVGVKLRLSGKEKE